MKKKLLFSLLLTASCAFSLCACQIGTPSSSATDDTETGADSADTSENTSIELDGGVWVDEETGYSLMFNTEDQTYYLKDADGRIGEGDMIISDDEMKIHYGIFKYTLTMNENEELTFTCDLNPDGTYDLADDSYLLSEDETEREEDMTETGESEATANPEIETETETETEIEMEEILPDDDFLLSVFTFEEDGEITPYDYSGLTGNWENDSLVLHFDMSDQTVLYESPDGTIRGLAYLYDDNDGMGMYLTNGEDTSYLILQEDGSLLLKSVKGDADFDGTFTQEADSTVSDADEFSYTGTWKMEGSKVWYTFSSDGSASYIFREEDNVYGRVKGYSYQISGDTLTIYEPGGSSCGSYTMDGHSLRGSNGTLVPSTLPTSSFDECTLVENDGSSDSGSSDAIDSTDNESSEETSADGEETDLPDNEDGEPETENTEVQ